MVFSPNSRGLKSEISYRKKEFENKMQINQVRFCNNTNFIDIFVFNKFCLYNFAIALYEDPIIYSKTS
jgi:hypothetical protein